MVFQVSCSGRHWRCGQVPGARLGKVMTIKPWLAPAATAGADAQQCVGNSPSTSSIVAVACGWQQAGQQHGSKVQAGLTCRSPADTSRARCTVQGRKPHAPGHTGRHPVHPADKGTCRRRSCLGCRGCYWPTVQGASVRQGRPGHHGKAGSPCAGPKRVCCLLSTLLRGTIHLTRMRAGPHCTIRQSQTGCLSAGLPRVCHAPAHPAHTAPTSAAL